MNSDKVTAMMAGRVREMAGANSADADENLLDFVRRLDVACAPHVVRSIDAFIETSGQEEVHE